MSPITFHSVKTTVLSSAEETREKASSSMQTNTRTHTWLIFYTQAPHWGLIDGPHPYWTTDIGESRGNYKQPLLWDHSLKGAWGRISQHSGYLRFYLSQLSSTTWLLGLLNPPEIMVKRDNSPPLLTDNLPVKKNLNCEKLLHMNIGWVFAFIELESHMHLMSHSRWKG